MARNDDRRQLLADAGLNLLAGEGARGLTHRGVDRVAGVPLGTTSNYFRTREALISALVVRIGERLTPSTEDLAARSGRPADRELFADYLRDIVRRLMQNPEVALALIELRLESSRRPEIAALLADWRRRAFAADVDFNTNAGLPGGPEEIALFHYAIDGLILDHLTTPLLPESSTDEAIDALVTGLLPPSRELCLEEGNE